MKIFDPKRHLPVGWDWEDLRGTLYWFHGLSTLPMLAFFGRYIDALDALCFVPATHAAYQRRGFDHMELVARELAWLLGLPLADLLVRAEGRDQRVLGRSERADNLRGTVEVMGDVSGLSLLLVDDVITTGASLTACAEALRERGAARVTGCAAVRVW
jgi:predicted amidophosphoribosyltransferase